MPTSKTTPPISDKDTNPIPVYKNSDITIGLVFALEILNLFFNICALIKGPTSPGIMDNANPLKYVEKLDFNGI